jgi:hypothetical protein
MSENLSGIFPVEINGVKRDTKCNFGVVEKLECDVFKRPIIAVLNDAANGHIFISDVVDTILAGLEANRDTRFNRNDIGGAVVDKGLDFYAEFFIKFLSFAITGKSNLTTEPTASKKK